MGSELCTHLLFLHAFTGCDSTSRIYGVGKKLAFQKFLKDDSILRNSANVFCSVGNEISVITKAGYQAMICLFGGKVGDSLSSLRFAMLSKKATVAKSFVSPERLPPTESASD